MGPPRSAAGTAEAEAMLCEAEDMLRARHELAGIREEGEVEEQAADADDTRGVPPPRRADRAQASAER